MSSRIIIESIITSRSVLKVIFVTKWFRKIDPHKKANLLLKSTNLFETISLLPSNIFRKWYTQQLLRMYMLVHPDTPISFNRGISSCSNDRKVQKTWTKSFNILVKSQSTCK